MSFQTVTWSIFPWNCSLHSTIFSPQESCGPPASGRLVSWHGLWLYYINNFFGAFYLHALNCINSFYFLWSKQNNLGQSILFSDETHIRHKKKHMKIHHLAPYWNIYNKTWRRTWRHIIWLSDVTHETAHEETHEDTWRNTWRPSTLLSEDLSTSSSQSGTAAW